MPPPLRRRHTNKKKRIKYRKSVRAKLAKKKHKFLGKHFKQTHINKGNCDLKSQKTNLKQPVCIPHVLKPHKRASHNTQCNCNSL